ncbi:hypothetical protein B5S52_19210 [Pectobacterium brasiliense]|nr:hypothetical protein B5S52_19210 [Pectobacterium brasiliense]
MCHMLHMARSCWYLWRNRRNILSPACSVGNSGTVLFVKRRLAKLHYGAPSGKASRKFNPVGYHEHRLPVSKNLLKQGFSPDSLNQKWVDNITYLRTDVGWLYLAVVIGLWSRVVMTDRCHHA